MIQHQKYWVVCTTHSGQVLRSYSWGAKEPLAIGTQARKLTLERTSEGFRVRDWTSGRMIQGSNALDLGMMRVNVREQKAILMPKLENHRPLDWLVDDEASERENDKKGALAFLLLLLVFLGTSFFIQRMEEKDKDVIPEKYVQVVIKAVKQDQQSAARANSASSASKTVAKQARSLIKGGLQSILKQGNLTRGMGGSLGAMMKGIPLPSQAMSWKSTESAETASVASISKGKGFGRGTDTVAVAGQGQTFVSMDWKESEVDEGLTKEEVGRVIHAHQAEIRYCYESSLVHNAGLKGRVLIAFVIAGSGQVSRATVKESTAKDDRLESCVTSKLKSWAFPKPRGGINVAVGYPFNFQSLGT